MIFYYSSTGNTQWAVRQLAEATRETSVFIPETLRKDRCFTLKAGERIGFCFPVHGWRPPIMVRQFIRQLRIETDGTHYCYALCTAGDTIGEAIDLLEKDLYTIHLQLDSSFTLVMPESYVGLPFMDVDPPAKERHKKEDAARTLSTYIEDIVECRKGIRQQVRGNWPRINTRLIGSLFLRCMVNDHPFHVDRDRCIQCGICAKVCPADDIDGGQGLVPRWLHNGRCLTCFSCYHHCPQHAIEFGRRTRNKGQYYFEKDKNTLL